jgi:hypothetical protein
MEPSVSWREYVDGKFEGQEKAVAAALAAAKEAVVKAENAAERRFEAQNEFRGTLTDQARTFMPRAEAEQTIRAINEKLDVLTARVNARDDRVRGMGALWGIAAGAIGLIIAIISIVFAMTKSQ